MTMASVINENSDDNESMKMAWKTSIMKYYYSEKIDDDDFTSEKA